MYAYDRECREDIERYFNVAEYIILIAKEMPKLSNIEDLENLLKVDREKRVINADIARGWNDALSILDKYQSIGDICFYKKCKGNKLDMQIAYSMFVWNSLLRPLTNGMLLTRSEAEEVFDCFFLQ